MFSLVHLKCKTHSIFSRNFNLNTSLFYTKIKQTVPVPNDFMLVNFSDWCHWTLLMISEKLFDAVGIRSYVESTWCIHPLFVRILKIWCCVLHLKTGILHFRYFVKYNNLSLPITRQIMTSRTLSWWKSFSCYYCSQITLFFKYFVLPYSIDVILMLMIRGHGDICQHFKDISTCHQIHIWLISCQWRTYFNKTHKFVRNWWSNWNKQAAKLCAHV